MSDLRITALSPDRQHLQKIERALQRSAPDGHFVFIEESLQRAEGLAKSLAADILIVDCSGEDAAELAPLEEISLLHPRIAMLVLCKRQSPEFLIRAMQLGVREVLNSPIDQFSLNTAIERIKAKASNATAAATANATVLAFVPCKGGSGATFLAANLAYALSAQGDCKVALFDLNLQFGDALLFLTEQKAAHTLSDVVQGIHRLDVAFLKTSMVSVAPNLDVIAARRRRWISNPSISMRWCGWPVVITTTSSSTSGTRWMRRPSRRSTRRTRSMRCCKARCRSSAGQNA